MAKATKPRKEKVTKPATAPKPKNKFDPQDNRQAWERGEGVPTAKNESAI